MNIRSVQHRGLLRLIEDDDTREVRTDLVKRLRNILAMLISASDMNGVSARMAHSPARGRPRRNLEHFRQRQLAADV